LLVKNVLGNAGSDVTGALDDGSAILAAASIGGASGSAVAMIVLVFVAGAGVAFEEAFAAEVEAGGAESEAEPEDGVRPSLTRAMAEVVNPKDDPKKASNMAAMASLTSLPLT
jgi:hypothetical protein